MEQYLAWEAEQSTRNEFVDGAPRAMVGGTVAHGRIGTNLRGLLWAALRGHRCQVQGPDTKIITGNGNVRYPDAVIDCSRTLRTALTLTDPVVVFEILSRSTAWVDQTLEPRACVATKLRDYAATLSISHYVLISQDEPRAVIHTRDERGAIERTATLIEGPGATIDMPSLGLSIPLADLYEGLET